MKFLQNINFPAHLGLCCDSFITPGSKNLVIRKFMNETVEDNAVNLDPLLHVISYSWSEGPANEINDNQFLFACGLKASKPSSSFIGLFTVNITNYSVSYRELPSIPSVMKIAKNQPSHDLAARQVLWKPKSNDTLAARVLFGNVSAVFVWRGINFNDLSFVPEPKQILSDEVSHIEWPLESFMYFLSVSAAKVNVRCLDTNSFSNTQLNAETKTYVKLRFDPFRSRFSFVDSGNLKIYQNTMQVHSISLLPPKLEASASSILHDWNPIVCNQLVVLITGTKQLVLIDLFYSEATGSSSAHSIPPLKRTFSFNCDQSVTALCWAPWQKSRGDQLLIGLVSNEIVSSFLPVHLTSSGFDKQFNISSICNTTIYSTDNMQDDIAAKMNRRAQNKYGPISDRLPTVEITEDESLCQLWVKLEHLKNRQRSMLKNNERFSLKNVVGIPGILDILNNGAINHPVDNSETNLKFFDRELENIVYDTVMRKHCLSYCEWEFKVINDAQLENLESYVNKVHDGNNEVGAALAWVHSRAQLCLTYLDRIPNAAFSLALSGLVSSYKSTLWTEKCRLLTIENPYLKALFGFLAKPQTPKDVLKADLTRFPATGVNKGKRGLPAMRLEDHVAFACKLLPSNELPGYLNELTKLYTEYGNLDGLFLTGITPRCLDLLQSYLDRTGDIQTVVLILLYTNSSSQQFIQQASQWDSNSLRLITEWIEEYRSLLDSWEFYDVRVKFDRAAKCFDTDAKLSQIVASCIFCSVPFNNSERKDVMRKPNHVQNFSSEPKVTHSCSNCGNFLPRCSVCLQIVGTASTHSTATTRTGKTKMGQNVSGSNIEEKFMLSKTPTPTVSSSGAIGTTKTNPFKSWFVWCNSCSHGGHASHVSSWFEAHSICPVEKCKCRCSSYD
ncbi:GATOR2 complex protein MIOS-like [Convolutriloba macropyga]|uniref:GATOR2 complex protein MIOS-like n=1 Tax=Convolutriloba macropyga TaxID=536237 RepID=UPI003F523B4E